MGPAGFLSPGFLSLTVGGSSVPWSYDVSQDLVPALQSREDAVERNVQVGEATPNLAAEPEGTAAWR